MRVCQFRHYGKAVELYGDTKVPQLCTLSLTKRVKSVNCSTGVLHFVVYPLTRKRSAARMADAIQITGSVESLEKMPEVMGAEVRRLAHDLSNALEIIVQTSYLLSTVGLEQPASDWLGMLDSGVQKALTINQDLRTYLKLHA